MRGTTAKRLRTLAELNVEMSGRFAASSKPPGLLIREEYERLKRLWKRTNHLEKERVFYDGI